MENVIVIIILFAVASFAIYKLWNVKGADLNGPEEVAFDIHSKEKRIRNSSYSSDSKEQSEIEEGTSSGDDF